MKPITISIDGFCAAVGVGRTKTYSMIANGELDSIRLGRRRLILMASVDALFARTSSHSSSQEAE